MGLVLDTSVLIRAERKLFDLEDFLISRGDDVVGMAAVTAAELLNGCYRSNGAGSRAIRLAFVEGLMDAVPVLPFGVPEARLEAELWADLVKRGELIAHQDMLVAATALARGYELATINRKAFELVAGLRLAEVGAFVV
ncbi:MAG: PIN domain-containing protein [Gemmatimonadota bacterium]|nr:PIN domain-containing protein [Gemmatimonadota bacterium]